MRVLILGATGKIGGMALERAIAEGHDVVALVGDAARLTQGERLTLRHGGHLRCHTKSGDTTGAEP